MNRRIGARRSGAAHVAVVLVAAAWPLAGCAPRSVPAAFVAPRSIAAPRLARAASTAAVAAATEPRPDPRPEPRGEEQAPRRGDATARAAGWVSIAVGVQALAVAGVTSGMMMYADGVRDEQCDDAQRCTSRGVTANDRLADLSPWNIGAWTLGVAGVGVGTFLVVTNPVAAKQRASLSVGPSGSGAGLHLGGTF